MVEKGFDFQTGREVINSLIDKLMAKKVFNTFKQCPKSSQIGFFQRAHFAQ